MSKRAELPIPDSLGEWIAVLIFVSTVLGGGFGVSYWIHEVNEDVNEDMPQVKANVRELALGQEEILRFNRKQSRLNEAEAAAESQ